MQFQSQASGASKITHIAYDEKVSWQRDVYGSVIIVNSQLQAVLSGEWWVVSGEW